MEDCQAKRIVLAFARALLSLCLEVLRTSTAKWEVEAREMSFNCG